MTSLGDDEWHMSGNFIGGPKLFISGRIFPLFLPVVGCNPCIRLGHSIVATHGNRKISLL